ncbi:MAG: hypothetical protein Q4C91_22320 [Eubacteriales bacterium]|nr:hypothetical protein [Eubacteriales bacterium]
MHKLFPYVTRKGAMCQWHMFSADRSGSGEESEKQQPVSIWVLDWRGQVKRCW